MASIIAISHSGKYHPQDLTVHQNCTEALYRSERMLFLCRTQYAVSKCALIITICRNLSPCCSLELQRCQRLSSIKYMPLTTRYQMFVARLQAATTLWSCAAHHSDRSSIYSLYILCIVTVRPATAKPWTSKNSMREPWILLTLSLIEQGYISPTKHQQCPYQYQS